MKNLRGAKRPPPQKIGLNHLKPRAGDPVFTKMLFMLNLVSFSKKRNQLNLCSFELPLLQISVFVRPV